MYSFHEIIQQTKALMRTNLARYYIYELILVLRTRTFHLPSGVWRIKSKLKSTHDVRSREIKRPLTDIKIFA